ncbi:MAG TPA: PQQ-binding-like beta-propeller repeat protein [Thermomicrobiales bacterium]|nr:PQQ-binding-like beta-propeller repeat protein [Thermomicrobiales bacterium]
MTERTTQQLDHELDIFWNALVAGDSPLPESAETAVAARLARLEAAPPPRAGFLDDLWAQLMEPDAVEPILPVEPAPVVAIAPRPVRPAWDTRSHFQRWGKLAAAIAALLAVAAVGALLVTDRQQSGPAPAGQPWSMTGGNPGKTNANPAGSPIADPTMQWRTETNGRIDGAPVAADGVIFVGNQEHAVVALDADTGLQLWEANVRKPVASTVAAANGIVVAGTSTSLYGLDIETGQTVWQREDLIPQGAPTIVDDTVFVVDVTFRIRALALETGEDRWSSDPSATAPAFAIDEHDHRLIATTEAGIVWGISTEDGAQLWQVDPGLGPLGTPLIDGDWVGIPIQGGVARIDGATGAPGLKNALPFEGIPALALAGDQLVASTDVRVVAYDRDSLDVRWSNQLLTGLTGGVTMGSSSIYLPTSDRELIALDRATGSVQWSLSLDEVPQVAPAVTNDRLYLSTRAGSIAAIGTDGPAILNAPSIGTVAVAGSSARALWQSFGGPHPLQNPTGIAVAPTGEIWVCDTANDRLQVFDTNGSFLREFGSHGSAPGEFDFGEETAELDGYAPLGHHCSLAFDASGALYVADTANQRVQRFPASALVWMIHSCCTIQENGTPQPYPSSAAEPDLIVGSEGTGPGQFLFASDVVIAPNGDIFVGDRHRMDVQRFDSNGKYIETIGKPVTDDPLAPGTFFGIDGIAMDREGRLLVADDEPQQIDRLEPDGTWTVFSLSRRDFRINGIGADAEGYLFVAQIDLIEGAFWIYDANGKPVGRVGEFGAGLGEFDGPAGVALDGDGHIFVTDWATGRVQKFQLDYEQIEAAAEDSGG